MRLIKIIYLSMKTEFNVKVATLEEALIHVMIILEDIFTNLYNKICVIDVTNVEYMLNYQKTIDYIKN